VRESQPAAGLLAFLYGESQLWEGERQNGGWQRLDARIGAVFQRGQRSGEFRIDLTPVWLTEALYGLIASCAWATLDGRVAARDFPTMVAELLLGGALRREES
jgi:hypothetical protein